jgi:uncharacterized repeat protein (TIGR01451 family)
VNEYAIVVGSYDPNDKRMAPGVEIEPGVFITDTSAHELTYTIRFQNTGTAPAQFVVIRDTLNATVLDPGSFRMVSASHPYTWEISGPGIVKWTFNPINLPDSNSNEPASHGFVKFTIDRRPNLMIGDSITNRAAIYFDFNAPVITEPCIAILDIVEDVADTTEGLAEYAIPQMRLFPNPSTGAVTIALKANTQVQSVQVVDVTGRVVHCATPLPGGAGGGSVLDLSALPSGIYTVVAHTDRGTAASKLVLQ